MVGTKLGTKPPNVNLTSGNLPIDFYETFSPTFPLSSFLLVALQ